MAWRFLSLALAVTVQSGDLAFTTLNERSVLLPTYGQRLLSTADFNADGRPDLLLGGENPYSLDKTPLVLLVNDGTGRLRVATDELIEGRPAAADPVAVTADFNGDGRPDVAVFDFGHSERGQAPDGNRGFYGEAPVLLLSSDGGRWRVSQALADAARVGNRRVNRDTDALHTSSASAADIDRDGDIDIWVECSGGENIGNHFFINDGRGGFAMDLDDERADPLLRGPRERRDSWRYMGNALVDLNGDSWPDLVLAHHRRPNNQQEGGVSRVILNDTTGHFPMSRATNLPLPAFFGGWTRGYSLAVGDVNRDGRPDIAIAHTRSVDASRPDEPAGTGRFIQLLIADAAGRYTDETSIRMGDQSATSAVRVPDYGENWGGVFDLRLLDIDGDLDLDLMAGMAMSYVGAHAPLFYVNDGTGVFRAHDPRAITGGQLYFGDRAMPLDLDGDALVDFVHPDLDPGVDGRHSTGDERTRIVLSAARR